LLIRALLLSHYYRTPTLDYTPTLYVLVLTVARPMNASVNLCVK